MSHAHGERSRLRAALALTAGFLVVELVAGLWTGSLALLADAGHMLGDVGALALALWATRIADRPADARRSYGYHRAQVLAAFANALMLLPVCLWIVVEAVGRMLDPPPVMAGPMLAVAVAGLLVNLVAFGLLHGGHEHEVNRRGAALHVLGDLLGSLAAICAALIMMATGWWLADPLLSIAVAVLIGFGALRLARQTAHVLLEGAPARADAATVRDAILGQVPGVSDVHHVHSWELKPGMPLMTLHVVVGPEADGDGVLREVHLLLERRFGCTHATVQLETDGCPDQVRRAPA